MAILQFLHVWYKSGFISKIIIFKYLWIFHGEWEWKILLGRIYKVTHGMCTLTYGPNKSGSEWRHNLWTVSDIYYICFSRISMLKKVWWLAMQYAATVKRYNSTVGPYVLIELLLKVVVLHAVIVGWLLMLSDIFNAVWYIIS